jgi:3-hydroxyisobutyrate dehydrogenase-like beta-hydroxyacid dehydrogenase
MIKSHELKGKTPMSDISILGLGLMGGALARAFQQAGHKITVWNRSPEKMEPFVARAITAGYDHEDIAALIMVLRGK